MRTAHTKQLSDSRDWCIRPRKRLEGAAEARQGKRFKLKMPLRYATAEASGFGEVVNISSSGVLFTTQKPLKVDVAAELSIKWPVMLDDAVQLNLVAAGMIVRGEAGKAALMIEKYEFRTCGPTFFDRESERMEAVGPATRVPNPETVQHRHLSGR
jgi:hypothetical protein